MLKFSVVGPEEIVGVINGDMTSMESFTGDSRSLFNGEATVILRSLTEPGEVILNVTSQDFNPKKIKLHTK